MEEGDSETFSVMRVDDARNQLSRVNYICDPVRIYVRARGCAICISR